MFTLVVVPESINTIGLVMVAPVVKCHVYCCQVVPQFALLEPYMSVPLTSSRPYEKVLMLLLHFAKKVSWYCVLGARVELKLEVCIPELAAVATAFTEATLSYALPVSPVTV